MNKIKSLRELKCLTQEELSRRSGISREHLSNIENDKYSPNTKTIRKLAAALDVEAKDLM